MQLHRIIRRHSHTLEPIPTGLVPVLPVLPGIRAVLLDIYGTLLISGSGEVGTSRREECAGALTAALAAVGVAIDGNPQQGVDDYFSTIETFHQRGHRQGIEFPEIDVVEVWRRVLEQMAGRRQIDPALVETVNPRQLAVEYEVRVNPVWPMPGVRECLEQLRRRELVLGIISNAQFFTPEIFPALLGASAEDCGFDPQIQYYSYLRGRAKPGTAMFQVAAEHLSRREIRPASVLYVGNDMLNDVFPASQVGFRTALFAGDERSLRLRTENFQVDGVSADLILTDLTQLPDCLAP